MSSSSLVVRPSPLLMKKILGNCKSLSILSSSLAAANSCRSPAKVEVVRKTVAPWLMLPPEFDEIMNSSVYKFYRLTERDVKEVVMEDQLMTPDGDSLCLGSLFQGWLVYIQQRDCQVFLFNPLSGKNINLPSVETLPAVTGVIGNNQSGLIESFLDYQSLPVTPQQLSKYIITNMVLSSSPMDDDCVAMVTYGHLDRLAFCRRPGGIDANANCWIALDGPLQHYVQIVFDSGKKLFFALALSRELEAWDLHKDPIKRFLIQSENLGPRNDWPTPFVDDDDLYYFWDPDYLVYDHQSNELFIVTRYTAAAIDQLDGTCILPQDNLDDHFPYKTLTFNVFKVDFINDDHVKLQYLEGSLGNRAFFISSNTGFALSTIRFPELRPNSIYFTDNQTPIYKYTENLNHGGHDLGICDYKERSILSCYYPIDLDKIQRILPPPMWFTPYVDAEGLA